MRLTAAQIAALERMAVEHSPTGAIAMRGVRLATLEFLVRHGLAERSRRDPIVTSARSNLMYEITDKGRAALSQ